MKKILAIAIIIIAFIIFITFWPKSTAKPQSNNSAPSQTDSPKIISTKPDPLENAIVAANDTIEITFNRPLENAGEFKVRIDPKIEFKLELSADRKTAKIMPAKPYDLGATYTLFIGPDTKFDGIGRWGEEKIYHFRTIQYRGV